MVSCRNSEGSAATVCPRKEGMVSLMPQFFLTIKSFKSVCDSGFVNQ